MTIPCFTVLHNMEVEPATVSEIDELDNTLQQGLVYFSAVKGSFPGFFSNRLREAEAAAGDVLGALVFIINKRTYKQSDKLDKDDLQTFRNIAPSVKILSDALTEMNNIVLALGNAAPKVAETSRIITFLLTKVIPKLFSIFKDPTSVNWIDPEEQFLQDDTFWSEIPYESPNPSRDNIVFNHPTSIPIGTTLKQIQWGSRSNITNSTKKQGFEGLISHEGILIDIDTGLSDITLPIPSNLLPISHGPFLKMVTKLWDLFFTRIVKGQDPITGADSNKFSKFKTPNWKKIRIPAIKSHFVITADVAKTLWERYIMDYIDGVELFSSRSAKRHIIWLNRRFDKPGAEIFSKAPPRPKSSAEDKKKGLNLGLMWVNTYDTFDGIRSELKMFLVYMINEIIRVHKTRTSRDTIEKYGTLQESSFPQSSTTTSLDLLEEETEKGESEDAEDDENDENDEEGSADIMETSEKGDGSEDLMDSSSKPNPKSSSTSDVGGASEDIAESSERGMKPDEEMANSDAGSDSSMQRNFGYNYNAKLERQPTTQINYRLSVLNSIGSLMSEYNN